MKNDIKEFAQFNPGILGHECRFTFVKAELNSDFIWTLTLKFDDLPQEIDMRYTLHFALDPEPTRNALNSFINKLSVKQMEIGIDIKEEEKKAKENILELKSRYYAESQEMGVHSFEVGVLEFKNKLSNKEIKFLTRLSTIQKIEKLNNDMLLDRMVVYLEKRIIEDNTD